MKNKRLVDHICSIATLRYEVFLMSDNFFFFTGNRGGFRIQSNIYGVAFLRKKLSAKSR